MNVEIIIPNKTIVQKKIDSITAPGTEGNFQIYPRHIDFVSSLKAGILTLVVDGAEEYYAINYGILVKKEDRVFVVCQQVIKGESLEKLNQAVEDKLSVLSEREKITNEILSRMEIATLKRISEME
ncbi:MAG: hypothetical protein ACQEP4_06660 [Bacillota bacterium]